MQQLHPIGLQILIHTQLILALKIHKIAHFENKRAYKPHEHTLSKYLATKNYFFKRRVIYYIMLFLYAKRTSRHNIESHY